MFFLRGSLCDRRISFGAFGGLAFVLAACGGGSNPVAPTRAPSPSPSPLTTPSATPPGSSMTPSPVPSSATTTASLMGGYYALPFPALDGLSGYVNLSPTTSTPFPSTATMTLQSFYGEPSGGPAPQARKRWLAPSSPTIVASVRQTFSTDLSMDVLFNDITIPEYDPSTTYSVETFDENSGDLVLTFSQAQGACSRDAFNYYGVNALTVTAGVPYLTLVVANSKLPPGPEPTPIPCPSVTPTATP